MAGSVFISSVLGICFGIGYGKLFKSMHARAHNKSSIDKQDLNPRQVFLALFLNYILRITLLFASLVILMTSAAINFTYFLALFVPCFVGSICIKVKAQL